MLSPELDLDMVATVSVGTIDGEYGGVIGFSCPYCEEWHRGMVAVGNNEGAENFERSELLANLFYYTLTNGFDIVASVVKREHSVEVKRLGDLLGETENN